MTHLQLNKTEQNAEAHVLTETGHVVAAYKQRTCKQCNETFGQRKAEFAKDRTLVHRKCAVAYDEECRAEQLRQQRAAKEAERAARQAEYEANVARRGTDMAEYALDEKRIFGGRKSEDPKTWSEWAFFQEAHRTLERAREELATWTARLDADPANAFEWSTDAFRAAADVKVCGKVRHYFNHGLSVDEIKRLFDEEVYRGASSPARSTSPTSNLIEQEITAAYARVAQQR